MKCPGPVAIAAVAVTSFLNPALAVPTFRVVELNVAPKAGDRDARATGIASALWPVKTPWVSVQIATGDGLSRAVQCNPDNVCVDPFPTLPAGSYATAVGINNSGTMIGVKKDQGQDPVGYKFRTTVFTEFGYLKYHCREVVGFIPQAISSHDIAGLAPDCHHRYRPAFWNSRHGLRASTLPANATSVEYTGYDSKGGRVGSAVTTDGRIEAFVTYRGTRLIGTLGGANSFGTAVSRGGRAVGCSETAIAGEKKPFFFDGNNMTALPAFGDGPACATGISDKPAIVGNGQKSGQVPPMTSFLYYKGTMYDLNDLLQESDRRYHIVEVSGITNRGVISATAVSEDSPHTIAVRLEVIKQAKGDARGTRTESDFEE
jgi:uncharacterized membrane protein